MFLKLEAGDRRLGPKGQRDYGTKGQRGAEGWLAPAVAGRALELYFQDGKNSRIDHALVSPRLGVMGARYVSEMGGVRLAGAEATAISDHAALVVDLAA